MTTHYTHLTIEERVTLMIMRMQGSSLRAIAQVLGRQPSTLSREVRRQLQPERYDASAVGARARALKHVPRRSKILAPGSELFQVVRSMLAKGWSPQQIAAKLKDYWPDNPERHVSHETIYLTIYAYPRGELKRQLIGYLRQGGRKRHTQSTAPTRRERYPAEQNIRYRPEEVEGRQVPGHRYAGPVGKRPDHGHEQSLDSGDDGRAHEPFRDSGQVGCAHRRRRAGGDDARTFAYGTGVAENHDP